jgi:Protein of unknown function (DUF1194)
MTCWEPFRTMARAAMAVVLGALLAAAPSAPRPVPYQRQAPGAQVDVDLVLAVDASGSVDDDRFELQKEGYAEAFRNPKVLAAIKAGNEQAIAVSMVQWTGPTLHQQMVPWMLVRDANSADALARAIEAAPRQLFGGGTSVSGAIDYSVLMLTASPYRADRRVIDVSGDGSNNLGRPAEQARDEAVAMGIRINGLPILAVEPDLDVYYKQSVIGGPGAFIIPAKGYEQFADAILRKLVAEISQTAPSPTAGKFAAK